MAMPLLSRTSGRPVGAELASRAASPCHIVFASSVPAPLPPAACRIPPRWDAPWYGGLPPTEYAEAAQALLSVSVGTPPVLSNRVFRADSPPRAPSSSPMYPSASTRTVPMPCLLGKTGPSFAQVAGSPGRRPDGGTIWVSMDVGMSDPEGVFSGSGPLHRDSGRLRLAVRVDLLECRVGRRHHGTFARDAVHDLAASV
jgi:hypothetical protein